MKRNVAEFLNYFSIFKIHIHLILLPYLHYLQERIKNIL